MVCRITRRLRVLLMRKWSRMILAAVGTLVVVLILGLWIGARRQQSAQSVQVDRLIHAAAAPDAATQPGAKGLRRCPGASYPVLAVGAPNDKVHSGGTNQPDRDAPDRCAQRTLDAIR